jgi:hypothetical protein
LCPDSLATVFRSMHKVNVIKHSGEDFGAPPGRGAYFQDSQDPLSVPRATDRFQFSVEFRVFIFPARLTSLFRGFSCLFVVHIPSQDFPFGAHIFRIPRIRFLCPEPRTGSNFPWSSVCSVVHIPSTAHLPFSWLKHPGKRRDTDFPRVTRIP